MSDSCISEMGGIQRGSGGLDQVLGSTCDWVAVSVISGSRKSSRAQVPGPAYEGGARLVSLRHEGSSRAQVTWPQSLGLPVRWVPG